MAGIQPLRLGVSGSMLTLIACGVWFVATDQASEVRRRAFEVRDESLAAVRAAQNGVSVEEMKRRAVATCWHTKGHTQTEGSHQTKDHRRKTPPASAGNRSLNLQTR
jgi:hypothetical protein